MKNTWTAITIVVIVTLVLSTIGCLDNGDENGVGEVSVLEATITPMNDPVAYFNIRARFLYLSEFDFSMDGRLTDGSIYKCIYNGGRDIFYEFAGVEQDVEIWFAYVGDRADEKAYHTWRLIEGLVEEIGEKGTDDFTFRETDPETGATSTYFVTGIRINHYIEYHHFQPPEDAFVVETED